MHHSCVFVDNGILSASDHLELRVRTLICESTQQDTRSYVELDETDKHAQDGIRSKIERVLSKA
jgi:hypothetical protein